MKNNNHMVLKIHQPQPRFPVIQAIQDRFSPRFFSAQKVKDEDLQIIFEAARWTPSGHNKQPWHFHYAHQKSDSYQKIFSTLHEYNQSWAKTAPLLIVASAVETKSNQFAYYDLGAAVISLILQAQMLGYYSRQIGLFDKKKIKALLNSQTKLEPFVIIAMGKIGDFNQAPKQIMEYELDPRPRKEKIYTKLE